MTMVVPFLGRDTRAGCFVFACRKMDTDARTFETLRGTNFLLPRDAVTGPSSTCRSWSFDPLRLRLDRRRLGTAVGMLVRHHAQQQRSDISGRVVDGDIVGIRASSRRGRLVRRVARYRSLRRVRLLVRKHTSNDRSESSDGIIERTVEHVHERNENSRAPRLDRRRRPHGPRAHFDSPRSDRRVLGFVHIHRAIT